MRALFFDALVGDANSGGVVTMEGGFGLRGVNCTIEKDGLIVLGLGAKEKMSSGGTLCFGFRKIGGVGMNVEDHFRY
eukprot:14586496-Ditylum_brightwellii.AAC.1